MKEREQICRLCLKDCDNYFMIIEKKSRFLGFLLKSNLSVNVGALICASCSKSIKDCSNFKSACLDVEDFILQRIKCEGRDAKLNRKEVNDVLNHVCRLCMGSLRIYSTVSSDNKAEDVMLERVMLEKCLPELDLRVIEKPAICVPCREFLQHYFDFITNCLRVEEKIKKYCEAAGIDSTGLIKLKDVREFEVFIKCEEIKVEDKFCGDEETVDENLKSENLREMEKWQLENVNDQEHLNRFEAGAVSSQPVVTASLPIKQEYLKQSIEADLSSKPRVNDPLTVTMYECGFCSYRTKTKNLLKRHRVLKHDDSARIELYKCGFCSYRTTTKNLLKQHRVLKHDDDSARVELYKCGFCSYHARTKHFLKRHRVLKHEDSTVPGEYKCDLCSYSTNIQNFFKYHHVIKHGNPSAVEMYKCESCLYETNSKRKFYEHLLEHTYPSTSYECDCCSFKADCQSRLNRHLRQVHHKEDKNITLSLI